MSWPLRKSASHQQLDREKGVPQSTAAKDSKDGTGQDKGQNEGVAIPRPSKLSLRPSFLGESTHTMERMARLSLWVEEDMIRNVRGIPKKRSPNKKGCSQSVPMREEEAWQDWLIGQVPLQRKGAQGQGQEARNRSASMGHKEGGKRVKKVVIDSGILGGPISPGICKVCMKPYPPPPVVKEGSGCGGVDENNEQPTSSKKYCSCPILRVLES